MQKFTRPITREIEVGGDRVAVTFEEKGLSFRMVGSRQPPAELSWSAAVCQASNPTKTEPSPEAIAQALETVRGGKKSTKAEPATVGVGATEDSSSTDDEAETGSSPELFGGGPPPA